MGKQNNIGVLTLLFLLMGLVVSVSCMHVILAFPLKSIGH